ncbi:AMP-binding protein [Sciscionella marina]|uniref:AMP-binding protein n=1 Tax=Sciscionella marina TaxID=508770 RepID=UPI00036F865F|nr:AMP-binding protein [Sciscionella marina]
MTTVTELLSGLAEEHGTGIRTRDEFRTWAEHLLDARRRVTALQGLCRRDRPPHIGVLAANGIEFSALLAGAALGGMVLVGLNPTRRGEALAADIRKTDCAAVLTDAEHVALLEDSPVPVLELDGESWSSRVRAAEPAEIRPASPEDLLMLIFTSGTSGEPKAVCCTHGKIADPGLMLARRFGLGRGDTLYGAMPMFHSNAILACWSVALAAGANLALRKRFSASGFLPDVRFFGASYANYVGRPLSYVLATPRASGDPENPLRIVYGNEGNPAHVREFAERFGCTVIDAYGSTEGGVAISRTPETPDSALGPLTENLDIRHPETGESCPVAEFDAEGQLANPREAIGELVNTAGAGMFTGYYKDDSAEGERLVEGCYHTGDLVYRDARGFCYFVGRTGDWLRVDGENLGTAPIERAIGEWECAAEVAVYAVPDETVGDQVMAAIVPRPRTGPDPREFSEWIAGQRDLGPKQLPRFVRICSELPRTATFKVRKRELTEQGIATGDPVWVRENGSYHAR